MIIEQRTRKVYVNVVYSTGKLVVSAKEGDAGAVKRIPYDKDGNAKKAKWEIPLKYVRGYLKKMEVKEGKFGDELHLSVEGYDDNYTIQMQMGSHYAEGFIKRLHDVDFKSEVAIQGFNYIPKGSNYSSIGMMVMQQPDSTGEPAIWGKKCVNKYWDNDNKKYVMGYPVRPDNWQEMSKNERKGFYLTISVFLEGELKKHIAKLEEEMQLPLEKEFQEVEAEAPQENNEPIDDLPF